MLRLFLALLFLGPLVLGCTGGQGGDSRPKFSVKGTVQWKGKPLDKGTIQFESDPPDGRFATADILNGAYSLQATAGKKIVRISRQEIKTIDMAGEKHEVPEETLPLRFNAESTLMREVKADTENVIDIVLK